MSPESEKILIMYEPTLIDKLAIKALRTFLETDFKNTGRKTMEEFQKDM